MAADQPPAPVAEIVVTAPRLPPAPADAAFSIVSLSRAALEASPSLDIALEQVPGFSLFRRTPSLGANPTTQGASLRAIAGSGASRALVTYDGVPQNDPFGGWVIWTSLPSEIVGEARIVRGAGAGPYGAGALTGVVELQGPDARARSWNAQLDGGSLGEVRGEAGATLPAAGGLLDLAAAAERTDGWIPVIAGRGAADTRLYLRDGFGQARWLFRQSATTTEVRASAFEETRGSGLAGGGSHDEGGQASVTAARAPAAGVVGWRAQAWTTLSNLQNVSVSVAPDRSSTTLVDDQYATPALGWGANGAARELLAGWTLEEGIDVRGASGEDREHFKPIAGALTADRRAGGAALVGGVYIEASRVLRRLTLVGGARLDGWEDYNGHRIERSLLTGATTLDQHPASRGGIVPSGRLGARLDLGADLYLRAAAYAGFRPPTLNELYRPFRLGNNVTEANADLTPERLYGVEGGAGVDHGPFAAAATLFYNRLDDAIENVTLRAGPLLDPVEGFIPAGGLLIQRRNVAYVDAVGIEAEASFHAAPRLEASAALDWTDARVHGGAQAPALTGLRPAETPRWTATAMLFWRPAPRARFFADLRYESARFADDRNLLRLAPATTIDIEADWRATRGLTLFVAADNIADVAVATDETATGITSYGPPRIVRAGVRVGGG
ncbi:MAG TPA: TonB-dependent receptor [Caulobacteraceae bacterium]|nr:TonB-dependent receptor [Caulobacteraceae bacterium]